MPPRACARKIRDLLFWIDYRPLALLPALHAPVSVVRTLTVIADMPATAFLVGYIHVRIVGTGSTSSSELERRRKHSTANSPCGILDRCSLFALHLDRAALAKNKSRSELTLVVGSNSPIPFFDRLDVSPEIGFTFSQVEQLWLALAGSFPLTSLHFTSALFRRPTHREGSVSNG
jgi:hypothetical protein